MNNEINSLRDLYELLYPALKSKEREMHDLKHLYIKDTDIWEYLKNNVWNEATDLTLSDMVSDILHTDNDKIASYLAAKLREERLDENEN